MAAREKELSEVSIVLKADPCPITSQPGAEVQRRRLSSITDHIAAAAAAAAAAIQCGNGGRNSIFGGFGNFDSRRNGERFSCNGKQQTNGGGGSRTMKAREEATTAQATALEQLQNASTPYRPEE